MKRKRNVIGIYREDIYSPQQPRSKYAIMIERNIGARQVCERKYIRGFFFIDDENSEGTVIGCNYSKIPYLYPRWSNFLSPEWLLRTRQEADWVTSLSLVAAKWRNKAAAFRAIRVDRARLRPPGNGGLRIGGDSIGRRQSPLITLRLGRGRSSLASWRIGITALLVV